MSQHTDLSIDLAKLIRRHFVAGSAPSHSGIQNCNFIAYKPGETSGEINPIQNLFLGNNHEISVKERFIDQARSLLRLVINTFELVLKKYGQDNYPYINNSLPRLYSIEKEFLYISSLDRPLTDVPPTPDEPTTIYFGYQVFDEHKERNSVIYSAICDFFLLVYLPYSSFNPINETEKKTEDKRVIKKSGNIYANYNNIDPLRELGIPKEIADALSRTMRQVNKEEAIVQFQEENQILSPIATFKSSDKTPSSISLDRSALSIEAAEQFGQHLILIKDAHIIQAYMALSKYVTIQNSFKFHNVPISEIMEIVLKRGEKSNFNTDARKRFSEALQYLAAVTITIRAKIEQPGKRGKKQVSLLQAKGVKLIKLITEHPVKKAYQSLPKDQLLDEHFDMSVILRFSGELLPDYNQNFIGVASIYNDWLIRADAHKYSAAVSLGFIIETRFNQNPDKTKPTNMNRGYLIDICGYHKTDSQKPAVATSQLKKVLDRLVANGVIGRYENLTNKNADVTSIYPPDKIRPLIS